MGDEAVIFCVLIAAVTCQESPLTFYQNMDGANISEHRAVGDVVYTLRGLSSNTGSITYGITSNYFRVPDANTGAVQIAAQLDYEAQQSIPVRVWMRQGSDRLEEEVTVNVLDVNDEAPYFVNTTMSVTVPENVSPDHVVLRDILVLDPDEVNGEIFVTCINPSQAVVNPCNYFSLRRPTGVAQTEWRGDLVTSRRALDYEATPAFTLTAHARDDSGVSAQTSTVTINIQLLDVQDTPPVFSSSPNARTDENAPPNTLITRVVARDGDSVNARPVRYSLLVNPGNSFVLDPQTGELRTTQQLASGQLEPQLQACEVHNSTHVYEDACSSQSMRVTVADINNHSPVFDAQSYTAQVPEDVENDTPIATIHVSDADMGANATFSLELLTHGDIFSVLPDTATGSVTASVVVTDTNRIDYERGNRSYSIAIQAHETLTDVHRSSIAYLDVTVLDVNDNAPIFAHAQYNATVPETATEGTPVITITASDADPSPNFGSPSVRYKLVGNGADRFRVNLRTGEITIRSCPTPGAGNCLDAEREPRVYELTFYAGDSFGEGFITTVPVMITVQNTNDNVPQFILDEYVAFIREGETRPYQPDPLIVQATDADIEHSLQYRIVSGNPSPAVWRIDPQTGDITAIAPVDYEAIPGDRDNYRLTVEVNDGQNRDTTTVTINVDDVNEHPPVWEGSYEQSIYEDTAPGTVVETVRASDADSQQTPNGRVSYRLVSGGAGLFEVTPDSGVVTVAPGATFDYDARRLYNITLMAHDQGAPSRSATTMLWVQILDANNKNPLFQPGTVRLTIPEDTPLNRIITRMTATDPDLSSALVYYLESPRSAWDPQDNPVDPATFDNFNYLFRIDQGSGDVFVNSTLDYSRVARYQTTVKAVDNAGGAHQTATATLIVRITPVNTRGPVFNAPWTPARPQMETNVREGQPPGAYVMTLVATDDTDAVAEYRIVDDPSDSFDINQNTGVVTLTRPVDYETVDQLGFIAVAVDSGSPQFTSTATVLVRVLNVNDFTPMFQDTEDGAYTVEIEENSPGGMPLLRAYATDGDRNGPGNEQYGVVRYALTDPQGRFAINNETGQITVLEGAVLDREVEPLITLSVTAYDSPNNADTRLYASVPIYISLTDTNDQSPRFSQDLYNAVIFENVPPLSSVIELAANDNDDPLTPNTQLLFYTSGDERGLFTVDPTTGLVRTHNGTLRGQAGEYTMIVGVRDRGTQPMNGSAQVLISVLRSDSQAPTWIVPRVNNDTASVIERAPPNTPVLTAIVEDNDPGLGGEVEYGFYHLDRFTNQTGLFRIDSVTGQITTQISFDREEKDSYTLLLVARDRGDPPYESTRYLIVRIGDVNDNSPGFRTYYNCCSVVETVTIWEDQQFDPPTLIGTVQAIDLDGGNNSVITYSLISGNADEMFSLHSTTGELTLIRRLAFERRNFYNLSIRASDGTDETHFSMANMTQCRCSSNAVMQLHVSVLDVNSYAPEWASVHHACVTVEAPIGRRVTVLEAMDRDTLNSDQVNYYLGNQSIQTGRRDNAKQVPNSFVIGVENGTVYTNTLMERFDGQFFNISVTAMDMTNTSTGEPFTSDTDLLVWVTDPSDEVTMVFDEEIDVVQSRMDEILAQITEATDGAIVCVSDLRFHITDENVINRDWTDLTFHVIDPSTFIVVLPDRVVGALTPHPEGLTALGMVDVKPSASTIWAGFTMEAVLAAIVVILFLLLLLLLLLFCCCWVCAFWAKDTYGPLFIGTINPLWGGKEDQELTMSVNEFEGIEKSPPYVAAAVNRGYVAEDEVDADHIALTNAATTRSERRWQYESHQANGSAHHGGYGGGDFTRIEAPLARSSMAGSIAGLGVGTMSAGGVGMSSSAILQRSAATMTDDEMSDVGSGGFRERSVTNFGATLTRSGVAVERIIGDTGYVNTAGGSLHDSDVVDLTTHRPRHVSAGSRSRDHVMSNSHVSLLPGGRPRQSTISRTYMLSSSVDQLNEIGHPSVDRYSDLGYHGYTRDDSVSFQGQIQLSRSLNNSPRAVRKTYRSETSEML